MPSVAIGDYLKDDGGFEPRDAGRCRYTAEIATMTHDRAADDGGGLPQEQEGDLAEAEQVGAEQGDKAEPGAVTDDADDERLRQNSWPTTRRCWRPWRGAQRSGACSRG
jgi:hypothetical protein